MATALEKSPSMCIQWWKRGRQEQYDSKTKPAILDHYSYEDIEATCPVKPMTATDNP